MGESDYNLLSDMENKLDGKLILVTAITHAPVGEGKMTTTVGLADGFLKIGKKSVVALRKPSLGPVFGVKGGAAAFILPLPNNASAYQTLRTGRVRSNSSGSAITQPSHLVDWEPYSTDGHASSIRPTALLKSSAASAWRIATQNIDIFNSQYTVALAIPTISHWQITSCHSIPRALP